MTDNRPCRFAAKVQIVPPMCSKYPEAEKDSGKQKQLKKNLYLMKGELYNICKQYDIEFSSFNTDDLSSVV